MDSIGYLIMKVAKDLKYELSKELLQYDLTPAQWALIKNIDIKEKMDRPLHERTSKLIAEELDFDKPTVSGIVARLEDKIMIKKTPYPEDKRSFILSLTEEAKKRIPAIEVLSEQVTQKSLSNLSHEQRELFRHFLSIVDSTLYNLKQ